MGKIKLNLVSGAIVEKPLINAFKANNNSYVVLDNEINGSMGLPIILVCKLENNKLIKIVDQNEWGIVKEYLKNIIAGNQVEFLNVGNELAADDIYYTQLTLPVPSFDALKNAYKVEEVKVNNEIATPTLTEAKENTNEVVEEPKEEVVTSSIGTLEKPNVSEPVQTPEASDVIQTPLEPVVNNENVMDEPVSMNMTEEIKPPVDMPTPDINAIDLGVNNDVPEVSVVSNEPVIPDMTSLMGDINTVLNNDAKEETPNISDIANIVMPEEPSNPLPTVENQSTNVQLEPEVPTPNEGVTLASVVTDNNNPFKEQKEAFMQACENMFDALVQKFEKELENHK